MHEIAYTLQKPNRKRQDFLLIRLSEQNLDLAAWRRLAKSQMDKEILSLLLKEETAYQHALSGRSPHSESMQLNVIHVSISHAVSILEQLAYTQKLYFNGKQLVVDLYGKVELYYEGKITNEDSLAVTGRLKWRDRDIALGDCVCIGPGKPAWFIHGISLKLIASAISWKHLHRLYFEEPLVLTGPQKKAFLDDLDPDDPDMPKLIMQGVEITDVHQNLLPYPLLILKDRSGAFADLWMDYGNGHKILLDDFRQTIKGEGFSIKRQSEIEKNWEKDLLETNFIRKKTGASHYYCPTDKVAKSLTFLLEVGWSIQDSHGKRIVKQDSSQIQLEDSTNSILIKGKIKFENYEADVKDVIGAFNRRERFVQIAPDAVGLFSMEREFTYLQEIAEEGELAGSSIRVKKNRFGSLTELLKKAELTPSLEDFREKIQNFIQITEALPDNEFVGNLRHYQQEGLNWLNFLHAYHLNGILADDMGLGKTVQVLAFISRLPKDKPILIVMPTSLLFNWKNEIQQFLPYAKCYLHQGPLRVRDQISLNQKEIILTSYTTLRLDLALMQQIDYRCIILDEAQAIKNPQTQSAQSVYSLRAPFKLCITGTPIENRLSELWSLFHFLMPDLLGKLESFEAEVEAGNADKRFYDRVKKRIGPFILRRTKQEVLKELPARIDQMTWIEMSESQRQIYDHFVAGYKKNLLKKVEIDGINHHRMEVLEAILRLRQICCHPLLVSSLMEENEVGSSSKFDILEEDLETIVLEGGKVLIYSQFTSMLKLMTQMAKKRDWKFSYLDGNTKNRELVVEGFQKDPSQSLFFISLKAGGVGLNLTSADYVYLYDPWWNDAVEEQAINRAHRIGREGVVIAKRLVVSDSIEEKMVKLKALKLQTIGQILEESESPSNLTIENLKFLLGS